MWKTCNALCQELVALDDLLEKINHLKCYEFIY
jgi:hypothetical protein